RLRSHTQCYSEASIPETTQRNLGKADIPDAKRGLTVIILALPSILGPMYRPFNYKKNKKLWLEEAGES
ncbi:hypothetical protein STEG23_032986, partial [Scotinomys teguina]